MFLQISTDLEISKIILFYLSMESRIKIPIGVVESYLSQSLVDTSRTLIKILMTGNISCCQKKCIETFHPVLIILKLQPIRMFATFVVFLFSYYDDRNVRISIPTFQYNVCII